MPLLVRADYYIFAEFSTYIHKRISVNLDAVVNFSYLQTGMGLKRKKKKASNSSLKTTSINLHAFCQERTKTRVKG